MMNAKQFLEREMENSGINRRIDDSLIDSERATLELSPQGEDIVFAGAISLEIASPKARRGIRADVSWGSCSTMNKNNAKRAYEVSELMALASGIALKWEAHIAQEKLHEEAIKAADAVLDINNLITRIHAVQIYRSMTKAGLVQAIKVIETLIDERFPLHTCALPTEGASS